MMPTMAVLLKQTFDTEEKIAVTPEGVDERGAKFVINPYDEYALEEALRIKERLGGQVVVVACGPERVQEALRTALAVGADEAIRLDWDGLPEDGHALSAALAAVIGPLSPDLILAGLFAVDTGAGSVALQVAERLGLPHASAAIKLTIGSADELGVEPIQGFASYVLVERDVEGDTETVALPLPALITAQQGLNEPRYPSLPGIMKAKRKPLNVVAASELKLDGLGGGEAGGGAAHAGDGYGEAAGGGAAHAGDGYGEAAGGGAAHAGDDYGEAAGGGVAHAGDGYGEAAGGGVAHAGNGSGDATDGRTADQGGALERNGASRSAEAQGEGALAAAIRTRRTGLYPPPPRAAGKRLSGTAQEQAAALFQLLRDEAKVL